MQVGSITLYFNEHSGERTSKETYGKSVETQYRLTGNIENCRGAFTLINIMYLTLFLFTVHTSHLLFHVFHIGIFTGHKVIQESWASLGRYMPYAQYFDRSLLIALSLSKVGDG